jgi:hypothetical protein
LPEIRSRVFCRTVDGDVLAGFDGVAVVFRGLVDQTGRVEQVEGDRLGDGDGFAAAVRLQRGGAFLEFTELSFEPVGVRCERSRAGRIDAGQFPG